MPPAALEGLQLNTVVSRRFNNIITGHAVSLLLVQTGDTRSIFGHYPRFCYTRQGWDLQSAQERTWRVDDLTIDAMAYTFSRARFDRTEEIVVDHFILLPHGTTCRDMTGLDAARIYRDRFLGAAQMQVVSDADLPDSERQEAFEALIRAHRKLIDVILAGDAPMKSPSAGGQPTTIN